MLNMAHARGGGGGGYLIKFNWVRLHPEIQPLTLLYTILSEKVPFYIPFIEKRYPFHIPTLEHCTPFLSPYNEVNKQYYGRISSIIRKKMLSKRQVLFIQFTLCDFPILLYTSTLKKVPLLGGASPYRPMYGVPPPPLLQDAI